MPSNEAVKAPIDGIKESAQLTSGNDVAKVQLEPAVTAVRHEADPADQPKSYYESAMEKIGSAAVTVKDDAQWAFDGTKAAAVTAKDDAKWAYEGTKAAAVTAKDDAVWAFEGTKAAAMTAKDDAIWAYEGTKAAAMTAKDDAIWAYEGTKDAISSATESVKHAFTPTKTDDAAVMKDPTTIQHVEAAAGAEAKAKVHEATG